MEMNFLHVYVAETCEQLNIETIYPKERKVEILACKNDKVKLEKFSVWKLLEIAVFKSLGYKMNDIKFEKTSSGKWLCDKFYFSLSHSKNAVAVALSSLPVGVDIQLIKEPKNWNVANKVLCDDELLKLNSLKDYDKEEYFILKWTEKESIFKMQNKKSFLGANPKEFKNLVSSKKIEINGEQYFLSVACENLKNLQYFVEI